MLVHLPREVGYGLTAPVKSGPPLGGHGAVSMARALAATMTTMPEHLRRSLTWDQGTEMARHLTITRSLGTPSTSATATHPGREAPPRTPTDFCGTTSFRRRRQPRRQLTR